MLAPRMIAADVPGRGHMYYLVDEDLNFVSEVKDFLDWKAATKRAPATVKAYCARLAWYYRYLSHRQLGVLEVTPSDLTEFVIWLCNPYRDVETVSPMHVPSPLTASSVNLMLQAVGALYHFLVRRGHLDESPVVYVDVPRGKWLIPGMDHHGSNEPNSNSKSLRTSLKSLLNRISSALLTVFT